MANCLNCDSYVSEQYVKVFAPDELSSVRVCPHCEDKMRDGNEHLHVLFRDVRIAVETVSHTHLIRVYT